MPDSTYVKISMTIVPALEDSRSSALSCASLPEKRNCYLTTDFGDNHAEIAGLPEEDWGFSARLLGSHVKLLVGSFVDSSGRALRSLPDAAMLNFLKKPVALMG